MHTRDTDDCFSPRRPAAGPVEHEKFIHTQRAMSVCTRIRNSVASYILSRVIFPTTQWNRGINVVMCWWFPHDTRGRTTFAQFAISVFHFTQNRRRWMLTQLAIEFNFFFLFSVVLLLFSGVDKKAMVTWWKRRCVVYAITVFFMLDMSSPSSIRLYNWAFWYAHIYHRQSDLRRIQHPMVLLCGWGQVLKDKYSQVRHNQNRIYWLTVCGLTDWCAVCFDPTNRGIRLTTEHLLCIFCCSHRNWKLCNFATTTAQFELDILFTWKLRASLSCRMSNFISLRHIKLWIVMGWIQQHFLSVFCQMSIDFSLNITIVRGRETQARQFEIIYLCIWMSWESESEKGRSVVSCELYWHFQMCCCRCQIGYPNSMKKQMTQGLSSSFFGI